MSNLYEHPQNPGALSAPRRNNYYFGKLMDVLHFQLEQNYGTGMRRMLNRFSLGDGVLCGLLVVSEKNELCVCPGVAVDALGREIIVPAKSCVDPWKVTDDCGMTTVTLSKEKAHTIHLCLAYRECGADFAPVIVSDCNLKEECAPGTIVESFRLLVQDKLPGHSEDSAAICDALLGAGVAYEIVATIETGGEPVAVTVSHDGQRALVANETGPALHVIDLKTGTVTPLDATLGAPLGGVSVAPEGGLAFVTHANGIVMVELESDPPKIAGLIATDKPYGACAAALGGEVLYAIDSGKKTVDCIDVPASAAGLNISATIETGDGPADLAVSPGSQWLYVADLQKEELVRVNRSSNTIVASISIDGDSKTLAVRGTTLGSEAYVARDGTVRRIAEDGTQTDFTITADARDSAFTTSGDRLYIVNRTATANELVVFRAGDMSEIARITVGDNPTNVAVVPDSRRALVTNADAGTINIIDVVPTKRLCEKLFGPCPEPPACPCVSLATIELLPGGEIGAIDPCSHRRLVPNNATLLELILCLADRLDECCAGGAAPV